MDKIQGNQQALNEQKDEVMSIRKDGYYHVRTIATAIEKKQGSSRVLHGGQANITKDELFADESIHVEQALEPAWHWS